MKIPAASTGLIVLLCLTAPIGVQGSAPPLRYTVNTAIGFVRDNVTGLVWQRGIGPGTYNWDGARSYCQSLPLDGKRWRLPSVKELLTIVDPTSSPVIDANAFTPSSEFFWTSTPEEASTGFQVWLVEFALGTSSARQTTESRYVRCVQ